MIKSKKQSFIIIGVFALVLMLGTVTYAFFNYTRTGSANTIRTGRISFNTTQSDTLNLTNVFPVDVSNGIPNNNPNVGSVTINVTGDTTYGEGVEYLVSAVNVQNTIGSGANAKTLPISIDVSVASNTNNDPATTLGTADTDYFTNRGSSANTSIYKVLANDVIENNDKLVVGYIKSEATGVDGNIVIRAYLDTSKILISDTYNNGETPTDNLGTPTSMGEGKTVFTTSEWNSLQANGVSFQIKVEANQGTWVEEPALPTAAGVIGSLSELEEVAGAKRYVGENPNNYVIFNNEPWRIIGVYDNKLKIIKATDINDSQTINNNINDGNAWQGSDLELFLNSETSGGYFYSLSSSAKDMIALGTWSVGSAAYNDNANDAYMSSIQNQVNGKVGLIASYEYLYAAGSSCYNVAGNPFTGCTNKSWLKTSTSEWTLTPITNTNEAVLLVNAQYGYIMGTQVTGELNFRPVVYLKPEVTIVGGTGELGGNEYTLSYTGN